MTCFKIKYFVVSFCEDYNNYHNCNNIVIITRYCSNFQPPEGTGHLSMFNCFLSIDSKIALVVYII